MPKKRVHVIFQGRVQGVGFRFTCESEAHSLGVAGWVKNLSGGSVELVAEGEEKLLDELIGRIEGHFGGYISAKNIDWQEPTGEFKDFGVRF